MKKKTHDIGYLKKTHTVFLDKFKLGTITESDGVYTVEAFGHDLYEDPGYITIEDAIECFKNSVSVFSRDLIEVRFFN